MDVRSAGPLWRGLVLAAAAWMLTACATEMGGLQPPPATPAVAAPAPAAHREIGEETSEEFWKTLAAQRDREQELRQRAADSIAEFGYAQAAAPNLQDPDQLAKLRSERGAARFEAWRKRVQEAIRRRGALPWESGR